MYVVCVTVYVKSDKVDDFIRATEKNHQGSVQEEGCLRFDVLRAEDEPCRFFLYEVYLSKDAFKAHQQTEHYFTWRDAVVDMMDGPRKGIKHLSLFPAADRF